MKTFDWESRIREWSRQRIEALEEYEQEKLPSEVIESGYLGYPGATEEQISAAEARLGVTFPSSYREFLKVSNGLHSTSEYGFRFYSVEEIEWYIIGEESSIDNLIELYQDFEPVPDEEYFIYGNEQSHIRVEHLQTCLEISTEDYRMSVLLNPQVIKSDGEWEAWYFDSKYGDATRYSSFCEMMEEILNDPEFLA
ncbi:SMI1/KNR4 family protein [Nostoc sp. C057]|jgi:SMI1 / KNR4 family (SUKH-1)|uniref:SMI1/KNR4 family protein n=1 Tax=Nostoc sp. C057 TaxID=2576903 RepID=UPI0015C3C188|nr:SMI1/KNR4 family protein [Nostoc sp. C057]QLE51863.1 SMI1/KNR4 family protein [Nostoc sp. C057]